MQAMQKLSSLPTATACMHELCFSQAVLRFHAGLGTNPEKSLLLTSTCGGAARVIEPGEGSNLARGDLGMILEESIEKPAGLP